MGPSRRGRSILTFSGNFNRLAVILHIDLSQPNWLGPKIPEYPQHIPLPPCKLGAFSGVHVFLSLSLPTGLNFFMAIGDNSTEDLNPKLWGRPQWDVFRFPGQFSSATSWTYWKLNRTFGLDISPPSPPPTGGHLISPNIRFDSDNVWYDCLYII